MCDQESESDSDPLSETDYINQTPNLSSNPIAIASTQDNSPPPLAAPTVPVSIKLDAITPGHTSQIHTSQTLPLPSFTTPPLKSDQDLSIHSGCTLVTVSAPADSFQTVDTSLITKLTDTFVTQTSINTAIATVPSKTGSDNAWTTTQSEPPVASFLSMSKQRKTILNGVPGIMIPTSDGIGQCNIKQFFPQSPN